MVGVEDQAIQPIPTLSLKGAGATVMELDDLAVTQS